MRIQSGFAILDVKSGRHKLYDYFFEKRKAKKSEGIGFRPVNKPIPVIIEAEIVDIYGDDDGVSREFELKVSKVKVVK